MCIPLNPLKSSGVEVGLHFIDEPTNDLDIETMMILEDYLDTYDGIVITVSHDRYFLDRVVRRIFAFEENGIIRQYEGGYTDYDNRRREQGLANEDVAIGKVKGQGKTFCDTNLTRGHEKRLRFSYKEEQEYATIEQDIEALEGQLEELEKQMGQFATDFVKLREISEKKEEISLELSEKMNRWEYLEDLAEQIRKEEK